MPVLRRGGRLLLGGRLRRFAPFRLMPRRGICGLWQMHQRGRRRARHRIGILQHKALHRLHKQLQFAIPHRLVIHLAGAQIVAHIRHQHRLLPGKMLQNTLPRLGKGRFVAGGALALRLFLPFFRQKYHRIRRAVRVRKAILQRKRFQRLHQVPQLFVAQLLIVDVFLSQKISHVRHKYLFMACEIFANPFRQCFFVQCLHC